MLLRTLRLLILLAGLVVLGFTVTITLNWQRQLALTALTLAIALWLNRRSQSHLTTLTLVLFSLYSTARYAFWRLWTVISIGRDPGTSWGWLDWLFLGLLLGAEGYAFVVLALGYLQVLWPLHRLPVPLPEDPSEWPEVDLAIPTLDEPLNLVRATALAALNIDWPADKLHVYILDDGQRPEFRSFAEQAGMGYIARGTNEHAKAGNINHALHELKAPYLALFDCDHIPTRSFLQLTMGWMLRDARLAVLQAPQYFYSPDPFERNLDQFRMVPNENELYYGVVQDGNDFWNATCFCGSCAVLRRSALDDVGGMAVETVTEDAHTSLRMQIRGWNTAYVNIPQAAGLATESLTSYVKQRVRWARGMAQTLRLENPLLAPGLKPAQRLCYLNSMLHFLYALPRLIFLTAPLIFLLFGRTSIPGFWAAILAYVLPHLALSRIAHSRIQGEHRHAFWNEIYETVLAPYLLIPTLRVLMGKAGGDFGVTPKGRVVGGEYFDRKIARPFLFLLALNGLGLICAVFRLVRMPVLEVPPLLHFVNLPAQMYRAGQAGIVGINVAWALFNMLILGVAVAVARESRQRRQSVRVAVSVPSDIVLADGSMIQGVTSDLSSGGVRTSIDASVRARVGDSICFVVPVLDGTASLPATVVRIAEGELRAQFSDLTLQEDEALTTLLYSRADAWLGLAGGCGRDRPLRTFGRIVKLSIRGLRLSLSGVARSNSKRLATTAAPLLLGLMLLGFSDKPARAAQDAEAPVGIPRAAAGTSSAGSSASYARATAPTVAVKNATSQSGRTPTASEAVFDSVFTLQNAGASNAIVLRGVDSSQSVAFGVPRTRVVTAASLKLRYQFSPGLLPVISHLNVSVNGSLIATLPVNAGQQGPLESDVTIPAQLLGRDNRLTFELIGHYVMRCEDPTNSTLWAQIDAGSKIELQGTRVPAINDLSVLPSPFFDPGVNAHPVVQIAFLAPPDTKTIRAAAIIASWLGIQFGDRPVRFSVSVGPIPAGDAILLARTTDPIPTSIREGLSGGANITMRANPGDPASTLLVVSGDTGDEIAMAASALALQSGSWHGTQVTVRDLKLPSARVPDDAPLWMSTETNQLNHLGKQDAPQELQGNGANLLPVRLRLPPDLDYADRQNLGLHLDYRYNSIPVAEGSVLQISANGNYISSTPTPHADKASRVLETIVPVPIGVLQPFSNELGFRFLFRAAGAGNCEASGAANFQGAILQDSYLDISNIAHSAVLPNLKLFSNAGFPFTRFADLSQTAAVLPDRPTTSELELLLATMGHFGAETGYPVLRLDITNAAGMVAGRKDYLVIGTPGDQPALGMLDSVLPVTVNSSGLQVRDVSGIFDRYAWLAGERGTSMHSGRIDTSAEIPDALIEEIGWPQSSSRTVVAMVLRDGLAANGPTTAFLDAANSSEIAGTVSILRGERFSSYWMAQMSYRVGGNSLPERASRLLQQFPWLIALTSVLFCFVIAGLLQAWLRRRARGRLQGQN